MSCLLISSTTKIPHTTAKSKEGKEKTALLLSAVSSGDFTRVGGQDDSYTQMLKTENQSFFLVFRKQSHIHSTERIP